MSLNTKIILSITLLFSVSVYCSEIVIRPATEENLEAIFALSDDDYQNNFKRLWTQHYALLTPNGILINEFVERKKTNNKEAIENFVKRQSTDNSYGLLVALKQESVIGYCRFKKIDTTTMYMNNIIVHPLHRKQKIAKQLVLAAFNTWNTVTQCNFRALIHYDLINQIYKQHTREIITNPNTSKTHNEYIYMIQRKIKSK